MTAEADDAYDVIIIGAGFAGLAAGIRLAQFRDRVLILEAHTLPGGLNSYYFRGSRTNIFNSGLHTVTNARGKDRRWGLGMVCRNLGMTVADLELAPPKKPSRSITPGGELTFDADVAVLRESIRETFPAELAGFDALCEAAVAVKVSPENFAQSGLGLLRAHLKDPELLDLLAMPLFIYGGYRRKDFDLVTFATLFRSVYLEGFGAPPNVKIILDKLIARFKELGGTLKYRSPVEAVLTENGCACGVRLANGKELRAPHIVSSAGIPETGKLVGGDWGQGSPLSVFETVVALDEPADRYGVDDTLLMVSRQKRFDWDVPATRDAHYHLTLSIQDNYGYPEPNPTHHVKIGCFQDGRLWRDLSPDAYAEAKAVLEERMLEELFSLYPGLRSAPSGYRESLTPNTVTRYTSHFNGAIYGSETKFFDGCTPVKNLTVIGNDQAGIGIVGALTSGVVTSNFQIILK